MFEPLKPLSIMKLHDRSERCWAVIDGNGAIVDDSGLKMRMTRDEAHAYIRAWDAHVLGLERFAKPTV